MALRLDILANTTSLIQSMKKGGASIEDVSDALDDLAREGAQAGDKMERTFRDIAREASDTGRKVGREMEDGFRKAGTGAQDFKQEANSTAREAAASFDGSAESIADAFQEVTANAFSGFGPAGAVAGLAAAAGIGLVTAGFRAADEANKESQQAVADWANAFIEAGDKALSAGITAARFTEIITDPEKFAEAEKNAADWGVAVETAISAMSGNSGAIADVSESVAQLGRDFTAASEEAGGMYDEFGNLNGPLVAQEKAYRAAQESLGKLTEQMDAGRARAELLDRYYRDLVNSAASATKEVDELGNELYTLPDGTQILIDADTGQATQNVDTFKGDLDGIPEEVTSTVKVRVDTSAYDNWTPRQKVAWVDVQGGISRNGRQLIT